MSTRLEKLEENLKKEQRKQDTRRLKRAKEYFDYGMAMLRDRFHSEDYNTFIAEFVIAVDSPLLNLEKTVNKA